MAVRHIVFKTYVMFVLLLRTLLVYMIDGRSNVQNE